MEWRLARAQLLHVDPHEVQGRSVHDVEVAAPILEYLVEAGVADDGVDDERIVSQVWDVVGVVLAAQGDHVL